MNDKVMEQAEGPSFREDNNNIEKFVQSLLPSMSLTDRAAQNSPPGDRIPYT